MKKQNDDFFELDFEKWWILFQQQLKVGLVN